MTLHIAPDLDLPLEAVTRTHGILAMRGAGKSNAMVVMFEEMYDAGLPGVVVDVKGDWWGVRYPASKTGEGLSVPIFGGLHSDLLLDSRHGRYMAELVVAHHLTCILDLSEMTKGEQTKFLIDFADRLFRLKNEHRFPLHLFLDEADEYIPQKMPPRSSASGENVAHCVGIFSRLVKQGRNRGLGVTMATQRSAVLNNDVLTQLDTLVAMRTTAKVDRDKIEDWVEYHSLSKDLVHSLPELDDGEGWLWSPQAYKAMTKLRFRRRRTFDSGATPEVGASLEPPGRLTDVDLAAIKEQMVDAIAEAEAKDPAKLQQKIRQLEHELEQARKIKIAPEPIVEHVEIEVPVVPAALLGLRGEMREAADRYVAAVDKSIAAIDAAFADATGERAQRRTIERTVRRTESAPKPAPPQAAAAPRRDTPAATGDGPKLDRAHRNILSVLSLFDSRTADQLAMLAGYHKRTKAYTNALGALRTAGYIEGTSVVRITTGGLAAITWTVEPIGDLFDHWRNHPKIDRAGRLILDALRDVCPEGYELAQLAEVCEYHERTKAFTNQLGRLRTLDLVTGARISPIRLADDFAEAIA